MKAEYIQMQIRTYDEVFTEHFKRISDQTITKKKLGSFIEAIKTIATSFFKNPENFAFSEDLAKRLSLEDQEEYQSLCEFLEEVKGGDNSDFKYPTYAQIELKDFDESNDKLLRTLPHNLCEVEISIATQQQIRAGVCLRLAQKVETFLAKLDQNPEQLASDLKRREEEKIEERSKRARLDESLRKGARASSKESSIAFVTEDPMNLKYCGAFTKDKDVVAAALRINPKSLVYAHHSVLNDPSFISSHLTRAQADQIMHHVGEEIRKSKRDVLYLIWKSELSLSYADENLMDKWFLLEALFENPRAFQLIEDRSNVEFIDIFLKRAIESRVISPDEAKAMIPEAFHQTVEAYYGIQKNPQLILSVSQELKDNPLFIHHFFNSLFSREKKEEIKALLFSLRSFDDPFDNKEGTISFFLDSLPPSQKEFGKALLFALYEKSYITLDERYQFDFLVMLEAVTSEAMIFLTLPQNVQRQTFFIKCALRQNPSIFKILENEFLEDPNIARIALSYDLDNIAYIKQKHLKDPELLCDAIKAWLYSNRECNPTLLMSHIGEICLKDRKLLTVAIQNVKGFYFLLPPHERSNIQSINALFSVNPSAFLDLEPQLQKNVSVIKSALLSGFERAILYNRSLLESRDAIHLGLLFNPKIIKFLPCRTEKDFIREALLINPFSILEYSIDELATSENLAPFLDQFCSLTKFLFIVKVCFEKKDHLRQFCLELFHKDVALLDHLYDSRMKNYSGILVEANQRLLEIIRKFFYTKRGEFVKRVHTFARDHNFLLALLIADREFFHLFPEYIKKDPNFIKKVLEQLPDLAAMIRQG